MGKFLEVGTIALMAVIMLFAIFSTPSPVINISGMQFILSGLPRFLAVTVLAITIIIAGFWAFKTEGIFPFGGWEKKINHLALVSSAALALVIYAQFLFNFKMPFELRDWLILFAAIAFSASALKIVFKNIQKGMNG